MATYKIPLTPESQNFQIVLISTIYRVFLYWCVPANVWVIDLSTATGVPVLQGIPLVANTDLLEPFAYLGIGGKLIAQTDGVLDQPPTYANLGSAANLYFVTP